MKHSDQLPEPPQLALFDEEEQPLFSKLTQDVTYG